MAKPCRRLFAGRPMPDLQMPSFGSGDAPDRELVGVGGNSGAESAAIH